MLPENQITQIKKQLIQQIESTFPDDKKQSAIEQIQGMNTEQLEEFLIQNKLIKSASSSQNRVGGGSAQQGGPPTSQCIFCSIIDGDTQSYKIDENKDSIAILEINPISKAHSLVIPKKHISDSEKIPQTAFALAKKISKKIKTKFKPKNIEIASANLFGHEIINILPIYKDETLNSQRQQAKPEELEKLQKTLEKKSKPKIIKIPKPKKIDIELPRRIP